MKEGIALYRRLLGSILPYRKVVALSVVAMVVAASLEPVLPALLKPLIDESLIGKSESAQWKVPLPLLLKRDPGCIQSLKSPSREPGFGNSRPACGRREGSYGRAGVARFRPASRS